MLGRDLVTFDTSTHCSDHRTKTHFDKQNPPHWSGEILPFFNFLAAKTKNKTKQNKTNKKEKKKKMLTCPQ
jgi:hypothetical protein